MKKIVLAFMLMLVSLSSAYALDKGGMFFEPMLTYETTDTGNVNFPAPTGSSDTTLKGWGDWSKIWFSRTGYYFFRSGWTIFHS